MIIVHQPSPTDIEEGYGFWNVVGNVPDNFNPRDLPVYVLTAADIAANPFEASQVRYWKGPCHEIAELVRSIWTAPGDIREIERALFGA